MVNVLCLSTPQTLSHKIEGWHIRSYPVSPTYREEVIPLYPETTCGDSCGTLPACAPLAVPYVPFQQQNPQRYDKDEALQNGTLFPGLNLPFYVKATANMPKVTPLMEVQALEFVNTELGLYLDTHPGDKEAFALFQQYTQMEQTARAAYVAKYGPISREEAAQSQCYDWCKEPWPWNYQEGGEG